LFTRAHSKNHSSSMLPIPSRSQSSQLLLANLNRKPFNLTLKYSINRYEEISYITSITIGSASAKRPISLPSVLLTSLAPVKSLPHKKAKVLRERVISELTDASVVVKHGVQYPVTWHSQLTPKLDCSLLNACSQPSCLKISLCLLTLKLWNSPRRNFWKQLFLHLKTTRFAFWLQKQLMRISRKHHLTFLS